MVSGPTVQALRTAAHAVTSTDHRSALIAIQTAQDALDAAKAHHLAELEKSADYELDGASTVAAWARDHLRLDARQTRSLINADATMRDLPGVADAAISGQIRLDHLKLFTFGLKHIGYQVIADPVLESGLPTSKGIRPQLSVIVGVETLHEAMTAEPGKAQPVGEPAELAGFGPIGPQLLSYLACTGDITPILATGDDLEQAQVLNVGNTIRLATPAQRKAVITRQGGICAAPGCTHTHLEIHHTTWWSNGGRTDLDELIGICQTCHSLVHRGLLVINALGQGKFDLSTRDGRPIDLAQRRTTRQHLRHIRTTARQAREARPRDHPMRA